jgi:aminopeptidase
MWKEFAKMKRILLARNVAKLLDQCVKVTKEERALIVTDLNKLNISEMIGTLLEEREVEMSLCIMTPRRYHGEEPTAPIAAAMEKANVIFMPTTFSLTHTSARRNANEKGARILSLPGYTEEMLTIGGLNADFQRLRPMVVRVAQSLGEANEAHIVSTKGTDLRMSFVGKKSIYASGIADQPGSWAAPPAMEATIAPVEDSTTGVLMVDGVLLPGGLVQSEVKIEFSEGKIVSISGGWQAEAFRETVASYNDPNVYYASEFGIGLNPESRMGRNYLEDETTYGTLHIGLGEGRTFGSKITAKAHLDLVLDRPTLELDGKVFVSDRKIFLE